MDQFSQLLSSVVVPFLCTLIEVPLKLIRWRRRVVAFAIAFTLVCQTVALRADSTQLGLHKTRAMQTSLVRHIVTPQRSGRTLAAAGTALASEPFSANATAPNAWIARGSACLTAGNAATPATSIPACGKSAPVDAAGSGALQLTGAAGAQLGTVVFKTALPTANGLQITLDDYSFGGTTPSADGLSLYLTDASQPLPASSGQPGAALGYAAANGRAGVPNAYVGVGFDEFGNFSTATGGLNGGPGRLPERIAARGSAVTNYQYLGGVVDSARNPVSLPFSFDQRAQKTRPASPSSLRLTLTPAGLLSVAVDRHDGHGFLQYYSQSIVGVGSQRAVPATVYLGLAASTGGFSSIHQVGGLAVTTLAATQGGTLVNPPALVSLNGALTFNVIAQANASTGAPQFVYNGGSVPPTLRLLPGDALTVNLTNNLPVPPSGSGYTNTTNLHYHGLHVSPQAPGDDSIDMLAAPGQSLHYTVQIPTNHPPGLYWYHTHAHGEAERQTLSGMSGALVIDGIAAYTPAVSGLTERILIARDAPLPGAVLPNANVAQIYAMNWAMRHGVVMHASQTGSSAMAMAASTGAGGRRSAEYHAKSTAQTRNPYALVDPNYRRFIRPLAVTTHCVAGSPEAPPKALTINGQTQPSIAIAPGEQQFWRVVNAGADTYLDLAVDNTQMQIVALDGVPLQSGVGTPASLTVSHYVLPPASRVEFIVTGPAAGTAAYLRTNCFDSGSAGQAMPAAVLASIVASGSAASARGGVVARVSAKARRLRFGRAASIRAATVTGTRTLYYSDQNNINGIAYDPAAPPQFYAQTGSVEEWTIVNNSSQVHTFHIHQIHFVVEAINGTTQSQQFVMDNVNVPAATTSGPGSVKLLLDFTDPTIIGTFLLHCHILSHEDAGMMAKIRIGTAPPLTLSATSVNFASPTAGQQTVTISGGTAPFSVTGCSGVAAAAVNGSTISILPAGAGACVLTIADAAQPNVTATIAIQVAGAAAVVTLAPTAVSFATPTAPAQNVTINGGTAPYSVTGCAQIATATLSSNVVSVVPQASGTCSFVISDANNNQATLSVAVNASVTGNARDNLTFHQNALRTGWYQNEAVLTAANVGSTNFGRVATLAAPAGMAAFGKVYAQPLFVTAETALDGLAHNLVIIAGSAGQVYAFDESTHAVVWHRSFTNPSAGIRQQVWTDTNCPDVNPDVGIIGTPVIDRSRDTLYVVVATMENAVPYTRLHAIGLGNGNDLIAPAIISGTVTLATGGTASISSVGNMNRSALLEANGNIYVALGSHCDQNAAYIHGWMAAYSASTLQETGSLVDLSNANSGTGFYLGSPWMSGFGPAADAQGNVYIATGNGPVNGTTDFSMSVLKLPGNLNIGSASYFTPATAVDDSKADQDLGSGGVVVLPDQTGSFAHLLIAGGKCSTTGPCSKYILNRDALGGQQTNNAGAVWSGNTGGAMWGGPAYFVDANGLQHIVYGGNPLNTYNFTVAPVGLTIQSSTNVGCFECRDTGSQPVVSSNGTQSGSAVVWALKTPGNGGGSIVLYAFDPLKMQTTLFTAVAGTWAAAAGASYIGGALVSPLVVDGRVYVPTENAVSVFGLLH